MTENGYIYTGSGLSADDVVHLLTDLDDAPMILEKENAERGEYAVVFARWDGTLPTEYHTGRVFRDDREVRWTLDESQAAYNVQVLTESRPVDGLAQNETPYEVVNGERVLLWGQHVSQLDNTTVISPANREHNVWIAVRIPRPLAYPIDEAYPRVAVEVKHYKDSRTGQVIATRWKNFAKV